MRNCGPSTQATSTRADTSPPQPHRLAIATNRAGLLDPQRGSAWSVRGGFDSEGQDARRLVTITAAGSAKRGRIFWRTAQERVEAFSADRLAAHVLDESIGAGRPAAGVGSR
jgi:hypothetical protein